MKNHTEVVVARLPPCDLCGETAAYDARMVIGGWAYLCPEHYVEYGVGLGLGRGQRLVTEG